MHGRRVLPHPPFPLLCETGNMAPHTARPDLQLPVSHRSNQPLHRWIVIVAELSSPNTGGSRLSFSQRKITTTITAPQDLQARIQGAPANSPWKLSSSLLCTSPRLTPFPNYELFCWNLNADLAARLQFLHRTLYDPPAYGLDARESSCQA
jgi:hypothetical protein